MNQLSLSLPLTLSSIERYLLSHGFAPHIVRRQPKGGLDILEEDYDALGGIYRVIYRVSRQIEHETTKIRFFGSAFSKGRFNVEVLRAKGWWIEYDVKPDEEPVMLHEDNVEQEKEKRRAPGRSSVSISATPAASPTDSYSTPAGLLSPPLPSRTLAEPAQTDPSNLPGPLGGCTLIIPNSDVEHGIVSVTISKNADRAKSGLYRTRDLSEALGRASQLSHEGKQAETIEDLIFYSHEEGRALANLDTARRVLEQLAEGRRREAEVEERRGRSPLGPTRTRFESVTPELPGAFMVEEEETEGLGLAT